MSYKGALFESGNPVIDLSSLRPQRRKGATAESPVKSAQHHSVSSKREISPLSNRTCLLQRQIYEKLATCDFHPVPFKLFAETCFSFHFTHTAIKQTSRLTFQACFFFKYIFILLIILDLAEKQKFGADTDFSRLFRGNTIPLKVKFYQRHTQGAARRWFYWIVWLLTLSTTLLYWTVCMTALMSSPPPLNCSVSAVIHICSRRHQLLLGPWFNPRSTSAPLMLLVCGM